MCKEKQLRCENVSTVYFSLHMGNDQAMTPFKSYLYSTFIPMFIYLKIFHYASIFKGFIPLVIVNDIACVYYLACD